MATHIKVIKIGFSGCGVFAAGFDSRQQAQRVGDHLRGNGWTAFVGPLMLGGFYLYVPSISIEMFELLIASVDVEMTEWRSIFDQPRTVA